jgi:hypothetical protein
LFANRSIDFPGFSISSGEAWLEHLICSRYAAGRLRLQMGFAVGTIRERSKSA